MGADQSTPEQTIYPQPQPVCATEPRFCLPHNVQLRLREKFFSMSGYCFKITDANNEAIIYFQCKDRAFSLSYKKILIDNVGVPVLNMKEKMFSFPHKSNIFAGKGSERQICKLNSQIITFFKAKISTVFPDVLNKGIERHLVLKRHRRSKRCTIYLGEPKQGGIPLARIFRPLTDYIIEIAANVDIAMCVLMCIALHEHTRQR